jgi:uncharacterized protein
MNRSPMTLIRPLACAVALGAALAAPAFAQSKKELAAKIVQLQIADYNRIGQQLAGSTAQRILQQAGAGIAQLAPEKREAAAKDIQAEVKKFYDSLSSTLSAQAGKIAQANVPATLEEKFSEDELKQLATFLESPVSKKFGEAFGGSLSDVTQKLVADTRPGVEPKIKSLEQTIQKKLSAAASAPAPAAKPAASAAKK